MQAIPGLLLWGEYWRHGDPSDPGYAPGYAGLQKQGGCNPVSWRWDAPDVVWVMRVTHKAIDSFDSLSSDHVPAQQA